MTPQQSEFVKDWVQRANDCLDALKASIKVHNELLVESNKLAKEMQEFLDKLK